MFRQRRKRITGVGGETEKTSSRRVPLSGGEGSWAATFFSFLKVKNTLPYIKVSQVQPVYRPHQAAKHLQGILNLVTEKHSHSSKLAVSSQFITHTSHLYTC